MTREHRSFAEIAEIHLPPWPDPEDHLVEPGTRWEVFEGERVYVPPARPGHGDQHSHLNAVIGHHVAPGYIASTSLLTRRNRDNDFATDTSVRRAGRNPATRRRYLEELAFEVFFEEPHDYTRARARIVVTCGVRRMFGIFGKERWPGSDEAGEADYTVAEWSAERDDWVLLAPGDVIADPALLVPIPALALIDDAASDEAAFRVLFAKNNPMLWEHLAKKRNAGGLAIARKYMFQILEHRKITLDAAQRARIEACDDLAMLKRWLIRATKVHDGAALLA
jgi:hypothetical protein